MKIFINHSDEVYNNVAKPFDKDDSFAKVLLQDLADTLINENKETNRFWLAANEIGYDSCAFAVLVDNKPIIICNPSIKKISDQCFIREIYDDNEYILPRAKFVELIYQDENGKTYCRDFTDDSAILICQATDCLLGIHPDNYGLLVTPEYDKASNEEREELLKYYLESLNQLNEKLDSDLSSNDDTKAVWHQYQFARAVSLGEVELEKTKISLNREDRRWYNKLIKKFKRRKNNARKSNISK